jgi:hypothetical protein
MPEKFHRIGPVTVLGLGIVLLSACTSMPQKTSENEPANTSQVGSEATEKYAEKPVSVERNKTTDPYTGTTNEENSVERRPIADDQSVLDKQLDRKEKQSNP